MAASSDTSQKEPAAGSADGEGWPWVEALVARCNETGIIEITHAMIREAILQGASALHLEPRCDGGVVRCRVAGELSDVLTLPRALLLPVTARLKLMASLELTEHRRPQQGRIGVEHRGRPYNMPIATMPTLFGESVVVEIVDLTGAAAWTWEKLEFGPVAAMRSLLSRSQGLLLFTGRPGSGKTALLYGALHELDVERRNIVMVTDPASRIPGVSRSAAELPVPDALRALMERDVDVILLDEARQREEIEVALEAATAGHLVLAVFAASDVAHAIERLIALGVSPAHLSAGLAGVVASRLARRVCPDCRETYQPDENHLVALGITPGPAAIFHRGKGCENCRGTGYRGHVGLYQLLSVDAATARLLAESAAEDHLRQQLAANGLRSFGEVAVEKALAGATTVEEALRFCEG